MNVCVTAAYTLAALVSLLLEHQEDWPDIHLSRQGHTFAGLIRRPELF